MLKLWDLIEIVIFGLYCDIWLILWYLAYIVIFGWYCESWTILEQKHLGTSRNIWDHLGTFGNMWGKGAICRALSEFWGKGGLYLWHRRGLSDRLLNHSHTRAPLCGANNYICPHSHNHKICRSRDPFPKY